MVLRLLLLVLKVLLFYISFEGFSHSDIVRHVRVVLRLCHTLTCIFGSVPFITTKEVSARVIVIAETVRSSHFAWRFITIISWLSELAILIHDSSRIVSCLVWSIRAIVSCCIQLRICMVSNIWSIIHPWKRVGLERRAQDVLKVEGWWGSVLIIGTILAIGLKVLLLWQTLSLVISWCYLTLLGSTCRIAFSLSNTGVSMWCWSWVLLDWGYELLNKNVLLIVTHLWIIGYKLLSHSGYLVHIIWIILILTYLFV